MCLSSAFKLQPVTSVQKTCMLPTCPRGTLRDGRALVSQFEGEMSRGCKRRLSVDPPDPPLESFEDASEIHGLAGVQNRRCSSSSSGPILELRRASRAGAELRRDESVKTGSPSLTPPHPPSPPVECPHPAESCDQVCQRPP